MAPPEDESKHTRRLSAVLLADLTGYSRLMGESEADALAGVNAVREVFAKEVPEHGGSLEVSVGDCFVALFPSAVGAVQAAVDIQAQLADPSDPRRAVLRVRIGVHLGEVVRTGSGLFGDSINIAARVQEFATPGGVNISEEVYRAVRNRLTLPFEDTGPHALKNTAIRCGCIESGAAARRRPPGRRRLRRRPPPGRRRRSHAGDGRSRRCSRWCRW